MNSLSVPYFNRSKLNRELCFARIYCNGTIHFTTNRRKKKHEMTEKELRLKWVDLSSQWYDFIKFNGSLFNTQRWSKKKKTLWNIEINNTNKKQLEKWYVSKFKLISSTHRYYEKDAKRKPTDETCKMLNMQAEIRLNSIRNTIQQKQKQNIIV